MWIVIIVIVIVGIVVIVSSSSSNKQNADDVNLELLVTICTSYVHYGEPPLKVTSLFDIDEGIRNNFDAIGHYLLEGKCNISSNIFDFKVDIEPNQRTIKEITISINSDKLSDYSKNMAYDDINTIGDILLDLEEYTEYDDNIELPIKGINFRGLTSQKRWHFRWLYYAGRGQ